MVPLEAIVSGAGFAVQALVLGVLVTAGFLLPAGEPKELRRTLIASAPYLLLAFLLIAAIALLIQGAKLQGGAMPSLEILVRYLTMTQSGKVWLLRESYGAALVLITLRLVSRDAGVKGIRCLFFLALPLVAGRSLTSHAVAVKENTMFIVGAAVAHLIATGLWGGGLPVLFWALYRGTKKLALPLSWAAETVGRFSRLALSSVAILLLAGLYQSWIHVGSLGTLLNTDYGNVLLLKLVLFSAMLGFGALNFFSTRPRLFQANQHGAELSTRNQALARIGAESIFGLLMFSVTGLLTVLPPGVHAVHQAALANRSPGATADGLTAAQPTSAQGASIKILSPAAGQTFTSEKVPLRFQLTKGKRGHHVHAYVDGELVGMFESSAGTLNGIKPGKHTLELRVVAEDHKTELDATDKVTFTTK